MFRWHRPLGVVSIVYESRDTSYTRSLGFGELLPELSEDEKEALGERIEDAIQSEVKNALTQRERSLNE